MAFSLVAFPRARFHRAPTPTRSSLRSWPDDDLPWSSWQRASTRRRKSPRSAALRAPYSTTERSRLESASVGEALLMFPWFRVRSSQFSPESPASVVHYHLLFQPITMNQHSMTFNARPASEVSLYRDCISRPVRYMVRMIWSREILWPSV